MIRIVLVDDHPVVRAGLRALVEGQEGLTVVAEADGLDAALAAVAGTSPDVVPMDLSLGDGEVGGAQVTAALRALPQPPEELFAGIRSTARGETVLAPSVAATLVRRTTPGATTITEREVEVLELLSRGLGNREMARELFVSEATVKSHLSHIYTKLGVDTRAGAVAAAIERRIIRA
ncbi:response regulator transcription factor [Tessaracoccus lubricantis]|uniref:Response regulator transcription factor n=2 Tax=Tessaracoccus lubricantis TaxID=545543 RepID=A0ABP9FFL4_9ACTN